MPVGPGEYEEDGENIIYMDDITLEIKHCWEIHHLLDFQSQKNLHLWVRFNKAMFDLQRVVDVVNPMINHPQLLTRNRWDLISITSPTDWWTFWDLA